jgi:hypothetical protein
MTACAAVHRLIGRGKCKTFGFTRSSTELKRALEPSKAFLAGC